MEKVKITNLLEPTKSVTVEAVIDTGATMLVLPPNIVKELNLRKMRKVNVRYGNNKVEVKPVYSIVTVEIMRRAGEFNVLAEEGSQPLIGQIVLEQLDLIIDHRTKTVAPNPKSPRRQCWEYLL